MCLICHYFQDTHPKGQIEFKWRLSNKTFVDILRLQYDDKLKIPRIEITIQQYNDDRGRNAWDFITINRSVKNKKIFIPLLKDYLEAKKSVDSNKKNPFSHSRRELYPVPIEKNCLCCFYLINLIIPFYLLIKTG